MSSTLILGGARSGKSLYAESRAASFEKVTYIATGVGHEEDADWQARIVLHQARRPAHWQVIETNDLPDAIRSAAGIPIVDCLTLWLTNVLDQLEAWSSARSKWGALLEERVEELLVAIRSHDVLIVSNEIGSGVHPETESGRLFRDELGRLNMQVASVCKEVVLVVAGIPLKLKG
ncbi:MAG TPA: bifunctional adenosylcobinamide kinase/adenosylcobinamide-phosphate guanylyltransferase [Candidatus Nanopelagicaceae bacterium]|nr:bifunctional adenosylcobinamide kinase/adenosylcobinamide-phosphate guanylyltransferase [Candidatus Nanopelagicaceae bacterium]